MSHYRHPQSHLRQPRSRRKPVQLSTPATSVPASVQQSSAAGPHFGQPLDAVTQLEASQPTECAQIEPALIACADALHEYPPECADVVEQHLQECADCREKLQFLNEPDGPLNASDAEPVHPLSFLRTDTLKSWTVLPRSQLDGHTRGLIVQLPHHFILTHLSPEALLLVRGESSDPLLLMTQTASAQDESWLVTLYATPSAHSPERVSLCAEVICDERHSIRVRLRWAEQAFVKVTDGRGQACFEDLSLTVLAPSANVVLEAEVIEDSPTRDEPSTLIRFPAAATRARGADKTQLAPASRRKPRAA